MRIGGAAQGRPTLWWRRRSPEPAGRPIEWSSQDEERLAEHCARFGFGTYADHLESRGLPVPAWSSINGLAHGGLGGAPTDSVELARIIATASAPHILLMPTAGPKR